MFLDLEYIVYYLPLFSIIMIKADESNPIKKQTGPHSVMAICGSKCIASLWCDSSEVSPASGVVCSFQLSSVALVR